MYIEKVEQELDRLAVALCESKTLKEWDNLVSRYNALKLTWARMTGTRIITMNLGLEYKQLI